MSSVMTWIMDCKLKNPHAVKVMCGSRPISNTEKCLYASSQIAGSNGPDNTLSYLQTKMVQIYRCSADFISHDKMITNINTVLELSMSIIGIELIILL